ncbi:MAG TPA: helix-turn-helix domain-containing protein [Armatimonadota bacterium]|jgi:excisionase family DNA binding protein
MPNLADLIRGAEKTRNEMVRTAPRPAVGLPYVLEAEDPEPMLPYADEGVAEESGMVESEALLCAAVQHRPTVLLSGEPHEVQLTSGQLEALKEAVTGFEMEVLTSQQLARYLKVSRSFVLMRAHEGKIPGTKLAGRWRFKREIIDRWLEDRISGAG